MLQINKWNFVPFFYPPDVEAPSGELTADDVLDSLNDESQDEAVVEDLLSTGKGKEKEPSKEGQEDTPQPPEEQEPEIEIEEPEEEPSETDYIPHVGKKEILKKYPDLFKDFPSLERAYYKSTQYEELFPTMADAKQTAEKAQSFDNFQSVLLRGKMEPVLKAVKDNNPQAFNAIVDGYMENLKEADPNAFTHVVTNMGKNVIIAMVNEAERSRNDNLKAAAVILNQFLFGNSEFTPPATYGKPQNNPEVDQERQRLQTERQQFLQQRFDTAINEVSTKCNNIIRSTITHHIDPKNLMSEYVRNTAVRDCMEKLDSLISQDERFGRLKDQLWRKAVESNFSKPSVDAIKTLFLNKNKTLLKDVIAQARNAALKGIGKRVTESREEPSQRGRINPGAPTSQSRKGSSEIPKGMSTLEFLNKD